MLHELGLVPLFDLGMRLGEGTGACLAMGVIEAAAKVMREMATFESAGIAGKSA
jgi:nicotinate-nucleotide--dimethylbenzimidazole phosphoribosyltransferase